ncbi:hypothetical protein B0I08_10750 [Glaciihabitans tibetensis]|uniref:Uncharacterized protein n=1 Tax=Glaciihabitans tibetensis TaxID=1266600 RepID=A0A2T0VAT8_9MICO|nr:DUF6188 family protein [Glaciihabitans tibetensis]PRY67157.1 hypothetical protein B0I08_10750 [Glaciihabitans tibetensis]
MALDVHEPRHTGRVANTSRGAILLKIRNEFVTQLRFDFAFTVVTESSETRIESPFHLVRPDAHTHVIDPEHPSHPDELLMLHKTDVDADCFVDGSLELRFSNGYTVTVMPDIEFEAWTLTRRNGELAVATPGGGLTTFGPRV